MEDKDFGINCCIDCGSETEEVCDECGMLCCCGDYKGDDFMGSVYLCMSCQEEHEESE